ncbi:peritrophin-1-like [Oratosquilla oratoria]|uniref:peritrophin-1-like n=1 Tax=Oratosquilla oratoria TaxID=337810 RepID=UPI003F7698A3
MLPSASKTASVLLLVGLFASMLACVSCSVVRCPAEVSEKCPATDPEQAVYFPLPSDCSKFCECNKGIAFEVDCPSGLFFDDHLNVCSWPDQVNCGSRPKP